jgi:hypothetical protein
LSKSAWIGFVEGNNNEYIAAINFTKLGGAHTAFGSIVRNISVLSHAKMIGKLHFSVG